MGMGSSGGGGGGMGGYMGLVGSLIGGISGYAMGLMEPTPQVTKPHDWNPTLMNLSSSVSDYQNMFSQNFGTAAGEANQTNKFDISQALSAYTAMQPQFQNLQSQIGQNALSMSKGQMPGDVVSSIGRAAASQGVQGGYAGGGGPSGSSFAGANSAGTNLDLRNLGMTSLDISNMGNQLGMQLDTQAKALSPVLASPMDFLPSMSQALSVDQSNNQLQNSASLTNTTAWNQYNQNTANAIYAGGMQPWNSMMQGAAIGAQAGCWVAREVFGYDSAEWKMFRCWLLFDAPLWLRNFYDKYGPQFANWIRKSKAGPVVKAILRPLMRRASKRWRTN